MKSMHWNAFRNTDRGSLEAISSERHASPRFHSSSVGGIVDLEGIGDTDAAGRQEMLWCHSPSETSVLGWPLGSSEKIQPATLYMPHRLVGKKNNYMLEEKEEKREMEASEIEMMKERFARLLLGEDMSGSGKGVGTALAISNAITNLSASVFGELYRLEPLAPAKKSMWQREMVWLLSVTDHIVDLVPTWQSFPDGTRMEIK